MEISLIIYQTNVPRGNPDSVFLVLEKGKEKEEEGGQGRRGGRRRSEKLLHDIQF